ncbi:MAG: PAS domain-containing protein, partial [Candidatus Binatia bacterium]
MPKAKSRVFPLLFRWRDRFTIPRVRLLIWPVMAFLVVLTVGGVFIYLDERHHMDQHRQALREIGTAQAHSLERQLDRSLSSTFALAAIIRRSGEIKDFDNLASEIIKSHGGISSLQLAPDGVVNKIYPLAGNEGAIGHDLLGDPRRRTEAQAAIESRKLTLAGPFELIQGGVAVIGRLPVFVPDKIGGERFWGFTIALIYLDELLRASNMDLLVDQNYDYELLRIDPDSHVPVVFARSSETDLMNTIPFEIEVPGGRWTLAMAPFGGWRYSTLLPLQIVLAVLAGLFVAGFVYFLIRQPEILRRKVKLRTRELAKTNRELEGEIVERKRVEGSLEGTRERLEMALWASDLGLWDRNVLTGEIFIDQRWAQMLGYSAEEIEPHTSSWKRLVHPEDLPNAVMRLRDHLEGRSPFYRAEYRMRTKSGEWKWILGQGKIVERDEKGNPLRLTGTMSDITERKQAEEALRESKENLQRLLETAKVIPWEADAKTWQFTYVCPQAVNFLGYPVNEWYQKDFWTSHIHPEDRESTVDFCLESTKSCKDYEFEYRMIRSDGNSIWLHDIVSVEAVN